MGKLTANEPIDAIGNAETEPKKISAAMLPRTVLGDNLTCKVQSLLTKRGLPDEETKKVVVRVLSIADHTFAVKPLMRQLCQLHFSDFPKEYSYRGKAIFAFQEFEGEDIMFFGMHVQEYGSDCGPPNAGRVYITYLDSVNFFTPKQHKTFVYREIILSYLNYVKTLGFHTAHIWACPPAKGDDYIFYCHPRDQKFPRAQRLIDWYKKMLDFGIVRGIIENYTDMNFYAQDVLNFDLPTVLPYFEGDFWSATIEHSIEEVLKLTDIPGFPSLPLALEAPPMATINEGSAVVKPLEFCDAVSNSEQCSTPKHESACKKRHLSPSCSDECLKKRRLENGGLILNENSSSCMNVDTPVLAEEGKISIAPQSPADFVVKTPEKSQALQKRRPTTKKKSEKGKQKRNSNINVHLDWLDELMKNLNQKLIDNEDSFFVIKLQDPPNVTIIDPDPTLSASLFDGREPLLVACKDNYYFSSTREAKRATKAMLELLHLMLARSAATVSRIYCHARNCRDQDCSVISCCRVKQFIDPEVFHTNQPVAMLMQLKEPSSADQFNQRYAYYMLLYHALFCKDLKCDLAMCKALKTKFTDRELMDKLLSS